MADAPVPADPFAPVGASAMPPGPAVPAPSPIIPSAPPTTFPPLPSVPSAPPAASAGPQAPATAPINTDAPGSQSATTQPADSGLTNKLLPDDLSSTWRRTKCLSCGYVYEGTKTLETCPRCGNTDPDKFEEAD